MVNLSHPSDGLERRWEMGAAGRRFMRGLRSSAGKLGFPADDRSHFKLRSRGPSDMLRFAFHLDHLDCMFV